MALIRRQNGVAAVSRPKSARLLALALLLAALACEPPVPEDPAPAATVRDSANIEIVENHAPARDTAGFWTVGPEPEFVIGGYRGASEAVDDPAHLVWQVGGAALLSDGRVAVLSRGVAKVLVFETSGALSASFGGKGQGPGEFSSPLHLQVLPRDTIVVWDYMFGRISRFDPSGALLGERSIDVGAVFAATRTVDQRPTESVALPLPDGTFLVEINRTDFRPTLDTYYRVPAGYARIDSDYGAQSFGWWDGQEFLLARLPIPYLLPFRTEAVLAAGGSPLSVYISEGDEYEVHQFSPMGTLRRIIRRTEVEPIPITSADVEAWKARLSEGQTLDWQGWDGVMAKNPPRPFRPRVAGLLTDTEGNLWVANRLDSSTSEWSVFDSEGRWLGTLDLPLPHITWLGKDLVLGVQRDPDTGVETVEGYRVNRGLSR